jgi:transglutaminase-like putative cysteine protease
MKIQRAAPANELLAKLLFLILPTAFVGYFLIDNLANYYSFLQNSSIKWSLFLGAGMCASAIFHGFRFRALVPFIVLVTLVIIGYKGIDSLALGEFDQPVLEANYKVLSTLFIFGWIVGWGFVRLRYWSIFIAATVLAACIYVIAKFKTDTVIHLTSAFAPAILYSVYVVFASEQIYGYGDKSQKFWWFLTRRLGAFILLAFLLLSGVYFLMKKEIRETVANYGGSGKQGNNSMLSKRKDGNFDLKNYSQLRSQLGRSNELLFCARINNFFDGTDIPNPLYLTAFYYTKFDTSTETFERDSLIPSNDLFEPDPSRVPLFSTRNDSSVIKNSGTKKGGRTVEIQVYSRKLSPSTYLAPHTGYFVQPITVEKDFRDSFKTAFRAKSYVSELNSAYFVYNISVPQIKAFQEQRFAILREAPGYENEDTAFMRYYTRMPGDAKFERISQLAHQVTANAKTPVDKVIALRDWFLSKDSSGKRLFTYSDNPGIPDIPNASKLMYFLFENRKGYCAYYAGATLFMLRALGIPSRIAVGFLTVDRSGGKNKGWYWYYADQAHAWVQVYFPGYGWLDFDTTVGNDEAQQSPQPDGTPPMQPPKAYLAEDGIVEEVDTAKKLMRVAVHHFNLHDKEFHLEPHPSMLDVHSASIRKDTIDMALANVQRGDSVTAISYADAFRDMSARKAETGSSLFLRLPNPQPIDEVYVRRKPETVREEPKQQVIKEETVAWKKWLIAAAGIVLLLLLIFVLLPVLVLVYYRLRASSARSTKQKAYWHYRALSFQLHQYGYARMTETPLQYARGQIEPTFGHSFTAFMQLYLKMKYAGVELRPDEMQRLQQLAADFRRNLREKISFGFKLRSFLHPLRVFSFWMRPVDEEAGSKA